MISNNENKYAELILVGAICISGRKKRKGRVIDAGKTAQRGYFLDVPEFICRNVE